MCAWRINRKLQQQKEKLKKGKQKLQKVQEKVHNSMDSDKITRKRQKHRTSGNFTRVTETKRK